MRPGLVRGGAIAVAAVIGALLLLRQLDDATRAPGGPESSSFATAPAGLAAYADLLRRSGHPIRRLREPLREAQLDPRATLVVLDPGDVAAEDTDALRRFVGAGGRLVGGGWFPVDWLGALARAARWTGAGAKRTRPVAPVAEVSGVREVRTAGDGSWADTGRALPLLAGGGRSVAAVAAVGRGRVVLLADASPLQNRLLDRADNAAFALALAGPRGRPVHFAESVHGYGRASGLGAIPPRWRWTLGGLLVAALAWMVARGRRLGPPEREERALPPPRREYVEALGVVLAKTRARRDAGALVRDAVRERLAARGSAAARLPQDEAAAVAGTIASDRELLALGRALARLERCEADGRAEAAARWRDLRDRVLGEIEKVVVAQRDAVEYLLAAAVVGGHVLLEGPPGVAKTLLANATARALRVDFRRLQFTPDMLPSDVTGTMALRASELVFRPGPIFTNVLLADEINRTPPKTQSALLEAMQERQVSIDGVPHPLPAPFLVVATQNPIEYEGTYPLPEAQLDRFLFKVVIAYLDERDEREMLALAHRGLAPASLADVAPVAGPDELAAAAAAVDETSVTDEVAAYVVAIVRQTRTLPSVELGASPRAAVHLSAAAKAAAQLAGRGFVTPDDVAGMAPAVLRHRLVMRPEAELERFTADDAVRAALEAVPVPR